MATKKAVGRGPIAAPLGGRRPASPPVGRKPSPPPPDNSARILVEHHLLDVKPAALEKVLSANEGLCARNAQWSAEMLGLAMQGAARKARWNLGGNTPDAEALVEKHRRCLDLLLQHGASVDGEPLRITPLSHAIDVGYIPFVELLLARGADPNVGEVGKRAADRVRARESKSSPYGRERDRAILVLLAARGAR